jgi:hypothetical protein
MKQLGHHWTDFHEIWYLSIFLMNLSRKIERVKICQAQRTLYIKTYEHLLYRLPELFLEREILETKL